MRLRVAFNGRLALVMTASLIVAAVVVATTVDLKFGKMAALHVNSYAVGSGAIGSVSVVMPVTAEVIVMGEQPQSLDLSFMGPFAPKEKINPKPITTSWLNIAHIGFRSFLPYECLDIEYHAARAELNSSRRVHYFITVTDDEGIVHTVVDETRTAPGPRTDIVAGALAGLDDSFALPIRLTSIKKLNMRFTPEGTQ